MPSLKEIKNRIARKQQVACEFDDLSENNLLNQIIKTTALLLLRNENVKFVADLCCYAHCAGAIMGNEIQDAMWSIFNAIKNYICDNWDKQNSSAFFCNID